MFEAEGLVLTPFVQRFPSLPDSVTYIAEDAFQNCTGLIFEVSEESYAYNWAVSHSFPTSDANPEVTLRYAELNSVDGTTTGAVAVAFKNAVEELSNNNITIEINAGGVLGDENQVLNSMMSGSTDIDIACVSANSLSNYGCQKNTLLLLPYTFLSREHFYSFCRSDAAQEMLNEPQEIGLPVRGLFYGEDGFRCFFTNFEFRSIEDFQGKKIRVANTSIMTDMVGCLGASSVMLAFAELYFALCTGVVDGSENPVRNYYMNSFHEVANTLILDEHTVGAFEIIISDNAWDKLTDYQRDILFEAAEAAMTENQETLQALENDTLTLLVNEGCNIVPVDDKVAWRNACASVINSSIGSNGSLYQEILSMA